jgi:16S rRNA (guanine527-N7)-methyltransferase
MNTTPKIIYHYFNQLTEKQKNQIEKLFKVYSYWNAQINVISRKDLDEFYERHVLHSLAIAKVINFSPSSNILDIGTGGGFPGIPLAILFPNCKFTLVDSIGKKIKVVQEVAQELGLSNVTAIKSRAEDIDEKFDFIVSRAVTEMPKFLTWTKDKFSTKQKNELKNGILYLKGGDLTEEMKGIKKEIKYYELKNMFNEEFFDTKKVVYLKN